MSLLKLFWLSILFIIITNRRLKNKFFINIEIKKNSIIKDDFTQSMTFEDRRYKIKEILMKHLRVKIIFARLIA